MKGALPLFYMDIKVFPLLKIDQWVFRASIYGHEQIMLFAFGPDSTFLFRFFTKELDAMAFIEECSMGKHCDE